VAGQRSSGQSRRQPNSVIGEGKTMHSATKRTLIVGAGLAAAALFGSLPYHDSAHAQGVPTQHLDVALVDATSDAIIGGETSLDNTLYGDVFGTSGLEASLYNYVDTSLGGGIIGATGADFLLGTSTGADGIFDGAASSFSSGVLLDTWATEDELNQLLGISATTSETAILADISSDPVSLAGDTLPAAGAAGFDADLINIADADYAAATTEFTNYLSGLGDLSGLSGLLGDLGGGGLSGLLGDLGLGSLGGLGTDLTTLLDGLLGAL
jgi:hypothetical protein